MIYPSILIVSHSIEREEERKTEERGREERGWKDDVQAGRRRKRRRKERRGEVPEHSSTGESVAFTMRSQRPRS